MAETAGTNSGSRLVDYFAVIGFDDAKDRTNVSVGKVIQRFPVVDWLDVPFIQGLALFCQPQGWRVSTSPQAPTFFISVLTDIGADRHYMACLSFSEARLTSENPTFNDDDDEDMDGADALVIAKGANVGVEKLSLVQNSIFESSHSISARTPTHGSGLPLVYYPKCLVLVSRHTYFETFRNCLSTIYAVYMDKLSIEFELLVGNLVSGVQINPPGGALVKFSLGGGDRQEIQPPTSATIPVTHSTVATLFQELGIYNVICLFSAVLTDKKMLFCSQSYTRLMDACHALSSLIYPLKYSYTYVPILPGSLIEALQSPTPFMMGLHISYKSQLVDVAEVICVDIDSGSVFIPESITVPPLPEPYQTRLQTYLTLVLNKELYTADYAFVANSTTAKSSPAQLSVIDKQIRACFIRLLADIFADYRSCLKIVRICPKPFLTFHKAAFLGVRGFQDDEFVNRLMDSMLFHSFVAERGIPYRACDLFDEVYSNIQKTMQEEGDDREKIFENIQQLAQQLMNNETPNQPLVNKVPTPSEWPWSSSEPPSILSRITSPFPSLDTNRIQAVIDSNLTKLSQPSSPSANSSVNNSTWSKPSPIREVPAPKSPRYSFKSAQVNGNVRRLDVLKNCLKCIFENKISDARKMLSAVLLSMKSNVVRVAFCQELASYLHPQNRATVEAHQFDLLVRLMNSALQNDSATDEYGVAYAMLSLATAYCRRLSTGVVQFSYTCIQDHPVWQNLQFWEAAFYHDVHLQLRDLYSQESRKSSSSFGIMPSRDVWNFHEEPCALKIAADKLRSMSKMSSAEVSELAKQEEGIIFSQAIHYANRIVYFRVPMDSNKLRKVNIRDLEENSSVSARISNVNSTDNASRDGDSTTESDVESGYADGGGDVADGTNDLGQATVRWLSKFLDKIGADAGISNERMRQLYQMIPGVVAMHIETIENVHRESKKLPPINKPKMLVPTFLPNEQMLQGYLRVYLLPDGRQESLKSAEKAQGNFLLPAEGAVFMTNYRLIFKGQPCDPYVCEQVVMRVIPIMGITKHKRIGQQFFVGPDQATHYFHDALQIRSATFQMMQIAFDEEVGQEKVQTFCQTLDQLRWPENLFDIFALSSASSVPSAVANTLAQQKVKHGTLRGFAKKTLIKTAQRAGFGKSSKISSITKAELVFGSPHGHNLGSPTSAGPRGAALGSTTLPSARRGTVGGNIAVSDSDDEKSPSHENPRSQFSRTLDRLEERSYCRDYRRLGLVTRMEVTLHSGNQAVNTSMAPGVSSRVGDGQFRLSTINRTYGICRTYPAVVLVPTKVSDDSIKKIAKGHKHSRLPVVTWCSERGALLLRGAGFQSRSWNRWTTGHGTNLAVPQQSGLSQRQLAQHQSQAALKSSVEQERYFAVLAALSPGQPLHLSGAGKHGLGSSFGSLLSLDSVLLGNTDAASMCSYSNTPDAGRKPLSLASSIISSGEGKLQKMIGIRNSGGKTMSSRLGLRPGQQNKTATLSGVSRTPVSSLVNPRRLSVISDATQHRIGSFANSAAGPTLQRSSLYIFGERSQAKDVKLDSKCEFISVDFNQAHDAKEALKKFLRAAAPSALTALDGNNSFWKALGESHWLLMVQSLLQTAGAIADVIDLRNSSVCVCLEYGWDTTAQLVSLAQLMLDPYYRTVEGFQTLIEKEWLSFGHRFSHRCNHTLESSTSGFAPMFLLFLDAVQQVHYQFPAAFEFNDFYLRFLAYHSSAAFFRTFLMDSEAERIECGILQFDSKPRARPDTSSRHHANYRDDLSPNTSPPGNATFGAKARGTQGRSGSASVAAGYSSIWDYINEKHQRSAIFYNFLYTHGKYFVLRPLDSMATLNVWDFYTDDPLSFGSAYDLEAAEAELQERQTDRSEVVTKAEKSGNNLAALLVSRKVIDLKYDSVDYSQRSCFEDALEDIRNQERDLDLLPQKWDAILMKQRQKLERDEEECAQIGATVEWAKWMSRNLHKKATIEILLKGRLLAKGGGAPFGGGQIKNPDRLSLDSGHSFQKYNPTAPEHCHICNGLLWSVVKQGLRCSSCELSCHEKCVGLASSNCPAVPSARAVDNPVAGSDSGSYGRGRNASMALDDFDNFVSVPMENKTYEGNLMKRGALLKGWKQRWFVLDSIKHELRYFDSKDDYICKGHIDLSEVSNIGPASAPTGTPRRLEGAFFDLKTSRRVYNFMAGSNEDAQTWIEKIQGCLYG